MYPSNSSQAIIQDFASTELSSYQIAYKYHLPQKTVESILRKNLTDTFFETKEKLAVNFLNETIEARVGILSKRPDI